MNKRHHVRALAFEYELFMMELTEAICGAMDHQGVSRADLARRLDRSRGWVTRLLRHDSNPTIKSLVEIARALDLRWTAELRAPSQERVGTNAGPQTTPPQRGAFEAPAEPERAREKIEPITQAEREWLDAAPEFRRDLEAIEPITQAERERLDAAHEIRRAPVEIDPPA